MTGDLDKKPYSFRDSYGDPGPSVRHEYVKEQLNQLKKLGQLCKPIREEAYSEFFHQTQIYLRHEPYTWYVDTYQQGLDAMIMDPLLAQHTKHVYWNMMFDEDKEDLDDRMHRGIRLYDLYDPAYEVKLTKPGTPWPMETYKFVLNMPNLTTLHIDVEYYKDWEDLKYRWKGCLVELYEWPTLEKLTLRLLFPEGKKIVRKAFRSRWVRRGRLPGRLKGNILNHLLTLVPEVRLLLLDIIISTLFPWFWNTADYTDS